MREWLIDGFRYDLWANRLLLPALGPGLDVERCREIAAPGPYHDFPPEPTSERALDVFIHLVWAQRVWLERVGKSVEASGAEEWLNALHEGWLETIKRCEPSEKVAYRNFAGQPFVRTVGEIAHHVINHGTYHRGQLREILGDLPGTDLVAYLIECDESPQEA